MEKQTNGHRPLFRNILMFFMLSFGLLCPILPAQGQEQKIQVSGIVKDKTGETVIGAAVRESGTQNATITDLDGKFNLKVSPASKLTISFLGYETQEIPVNGKRNFNVIMQDQTQALNEVVVVGYGMMRKKDLTGAVVQIQPDKIANEAPKTVQDVLRGTPGLIVGMDASAKGGGSLSVRGQRSVYTSGGHNDPLIILDGMIFYGELSEINPQDIGQIDVLKDASAAAVYGAKSANGVIIITTKKGKQGKPTINFNASVGFATMGANRDVFDPEGYLKYRQDWYTANTYGVNEETGKYEAYQKKDPNTGTIRIKDGYYDRPENIGQYGISLDTWRGYTDNGEQSDNEIWARRIGLTNNTLTNYLAGKTYDWYDASFRTGINQDYDVSISGANDRMNYYMSIGYLSNEGVAESDDYSAIRSNLKLNGQVTKWLDVSANVNFQNRTDGNLAIDWGKQITANSPFALPYKDNGELNPHPMGETNYLGYNYWFDRQYQKLEKGYTVLNTILSAKIKLPFNITYSFNASPRLQWFHDRYFESSEHPDWAAETHGANRGTAQNFDWSINNTINWDYTFADKHHLNLTLVQEAEERRYWSESINARYLLPTDGLGFHEIKVADKERSDFDSNDTHETADGMLARLFYSYDNKYMFTGSVRRDGYSAFGTSNPHAVFSSVALAWTFTNEKFFRWKPLSFGKLRVSWGQNGNRQLGDPYLALADLGTGIGSTYGYVNSSTGEYTQLRYMSISRMANPGLQWEKTTSWNVGVDLSFLDGRISTSLDYFYMPTTDMIMSQTLPLFSGFGSITCTLGEVVNQGFEVSLTSQNIKSKSFEWNTSFGLSYYKNEIKHLYYQYESINDPKTGAITGWKETDDKTNGWFIGQPISAIWDYKVTGIWQADEWEEAAKVGQRPGDPKVENSYTADDIINPDGSRTPVYNENDKQFLGQTTPKVRLSMRNDFTLFKDFTFSFNLYAYTGHKSMSTAYLNQDNGTSAVTNGANVYAKNYWTLENPTNSYARLDAIGPTGVNSPGKLYNRSFLRLENISFAYSLPAKLTKKWKIDRLKVFGTIRNVAVWKSKEWTYWDPETGGLAPRTYTLGVNLTF